MARYTAVVDALDGAFYTSFGNLETSSARVLLALDISGSMGWSMVGGIPGLSAREASAAMALVAKRQFPNSVTVGFSHELIELDAAVSGKRRLDDVCREISGIPFGRTDCAKPMLWANNKRLDFDAFHIYTDSETWFGKMHPSESLKEYRRSRAINAKLVVVGMVGNDFTIADPDDAGMLDVVGFDTSAPNVIAAFSG